MSNPYRDYYLASQENLRLGETVGVSSEQWASLDERYAAAIAACEAEEARYVTITISREDAEWHASWLPREAIDTPTVRLAHACRAALEEER